MRKNNLRHMQITFMYVMSGKLPEAFINPLPSVQPCFLLPVWHCHLLNSDLHSINFWFSKSSMKVSFALMVLGNLKPFNIPIECKP